MSQAKRAAFWVLVTLGGVVLSACPSVGWLVGIFGGLAMLGLDRRDRRWARLHDSALPPGPIAEAGQGQQVRLHGRVATKGTIHAPLSGKEVLYAALTGREVVYAPVTGTTAPRKGENERTLEPRLLGEPVEIDDGSGQAVIPLRNVRILSRHTLRHDDLPRGLSMLFRRPVDRGRGLEEITLAHEDEVWVLGQVTEVEDLVTDRAGGYRGTGREKRIALGGPDGAWITNLSPEELARVADLSPRFVVMGLVWLAAGLCNLGYTGWMILR